MKKFYLFFLALSFTLLVNAQHKNVSAVFSTSAKIVANTTVDIEFTVKLINTDGEFGDSVAVEFAPGVTPNSSPTDPFAPTTRGQDPEKLNGIYGQVVSWGDYNDTSGYGGVETGKNFKFTVNVTVDDTVTSQRYVRLFISGDKGRFTHATNPKDYTGGLFLQVTGPDPDLVLNFPRPVSRYYNFIKNQLPDTIPLSATVTCTKQDILTPSYVSFDASSGGYSAQDQLPRPFKKDSSVTVSPNGVFKPKAGKVYNLKVTAHTAVDGDLTNNSDSCLFAVTDTMLSKTDDVPSDSITLTGTGLIGAAYEFTKKDTISSLSVYLLNPLPGDSLRMEIYSKLALPDTLMGVTQMLVFTDTMPSGWYTLPLEDTLVMEPTAFFVAVRQMTPDRLNMGISPMNYEPGTNYVVQEGASIFDPAEDLGTLYANSYMLRVNAGKPWNLDTTATDTTGGVGITDHQLDLAIQLYPNPAHSSISFNGKWNGNHFAIFDLTGKMVAEGELRNSLLDVSFLAIGTYILKVENDRFKFVRD